MGYTVVIAYQGFEDLDVEREILSQVGAEIDHLGRLNLPDDVARVRDADALMVTTHPVPADLIAQLSRCQIISRMGTGIDTIDTAAAAERGIWVTNVPDYSVDEVSTHAVALLLTYARKIPRLLETTRQGKWDSQVAVPIQRLQGQRLGIAGFGRIGQAVATKARGLGLDVVAYDPYLAPEAAAAAGAQAVDWETLLQTSDYISLHMPLTDQTRRCINTEALTLMKPTALLINTARGALIDEDALLAAVRSGQIGGAALDVLAVEPPPPDHPLLHDERILVTPHAAFYSEAANHDVRVRAADEVVRVLRGQPPRCPVNHVNGRRLSTP